MVSTLVILAVVLVSLVLAGTLLWRRHPEVSGVDDWERKKHEIDIRAFQTLVDLNEERRLRSSLPPQQFRDFQRERTRLALRLLRLLQENADMLTSLAQLARSKHDPALTQQADEMIAIALELRLKLLVARFLLSVKWLFPAWAVSLPTFEPRYAELLYFVGRFQPPGQQALT